MKRLWSKRTSSIVRGIVLAALPVIAGWGIGPKSGLPGRTSSHTQASVQPEIVPGVLVIKMKGAPSGALLKGSGRVAQILKSAGVFSLQKVFPATRPLSAGMISKGMVDVSLIYVAKIGATQDPALVARALDRSGQFEYVEPKYMSHTFATPNDVDYAAHQASYFSQMNAPAGWDIAKGDSNVVIADVDGGTLWNHIELQANLWINKAEDTNGDGKFEPTSSGSGGDNNGTDDDGNGFVDDVIGWNFANNTNNPAGLGATPFNGQHGTATASDFGAVTNNNSGMAGSSWNCRLMPINASSATSDGDIEFGYEGIQYAYANGAKIINCSWGRTGSPSKFEQDIITAAVQAGALVVAAAGNGIGDDGVGKNNDALEDYPAGYHDVLAVGAVISGSDIRAYFSNYGLTVPVFAPGTNIWAALTSGSTGNFGSGTSFASPLTAGLAGLVKSLHPTWTPQQIATQIRMTADTIGPELGHGRVNFGRALSETHAGLEILSSSLLTPRGGKLFLPGDTVVLNMTVTNVLTASATNLSFVATTSDPDLQPLQGATGAVALAAGDTLVLPPLRFLVGSIVASKAVLVELSWSDRAGSLDELDAFAFSVDLFPTAPAWDEIQSPTFTALYSVSAADKNVVWACGGDGAETSPAVIRSMDGGVTWTDVTANLPGVDLYCISAIDSSHAWVGSGISSPGDGRIFATSDGGTTWSEQTYPAPLSPFIDGIKIFPDLSGFAVGDPAGGGTFVVLGTTDGGLHWTHLANEPKGSPTEAGWNNSLCWTDEMHGWFGTSGKRIWSTTNGGASWVSEPTPDSASISLSFSDANHGMVGFANAALAVTTDGGSSWSTVGSPLIDGVTSISYVPGTSYAWISDYTNPYRSTNAGNSWTTQTAFPFSGAIFHGTFADTTSGWMVTSFGEILRYEGSILTSATSPSSSVPARFVLEQNYPNPFNPTTTIRFTVPVRSRVKLSVYNVLGQRIAEVVDKEFSAGSYEQVWGENVASGIYFYRIEATSLDKSGEKFVDVKKMVLIK